MKTLKLRRDVLIQEGLDPDRIVAYWAEKGIEVVWGFPAGEMAYHTKIPKDLPTRVCPGCEKDVALHETRWDRGVTKKGMLGPWKKFCRQCEYKNDSRRCLECRQMKNRKNFEGRGRYCIKCKSKPVEERKSKCSRCKKMKTGHELKWMKSGRAESWCRACYSEVTNKIMTKKFHESTKACRDCKAVYPRADFPTIDKKRSHFCVGCTDKRLTGADRECSTCHVSRPLAEYRRNARSKSSEVQLNSVCQTCRYAVANYKKRRKRAREREGK